MKRSVCSNIVYSKLTGETINFQMNSSLSLCHSEDLSSTCRSLEKEVSVLTSLVEVKLLHLFPFLLIWFQEDIFVFSRYF